MTEDELKKYTVDFMNNEIGSNKSNLNSAMGKMLIKYAEVFQNRIAELERFIKTQDRKLRQQSEECDKAINRVETLVKENAELKQLIEWLDMAINSDIPIADKLAELKETIKNCNIHIKNLEICNDELEIRKQELERENAELKSEKGCESCTKFDEVKLTKAKELIRDFIAVAIDYIDKEDKNYSYIVEAEQFLKENE